MEYTREIKVRVYIDTNKKTIDQEYEPNEGESLSQLLRRLADEYEHKEDFDEWASGTTPFRGRKKE